MPAARVSEQDGTGPDPDDALVEEIVPLRGRELAVLRPRDSEALLREEAFEHEELLPYWAELWPSGVALAKAVAVAAVGGMRVLELGCGGLALPSIAAALGGAEVLATDWSRDAVDLAQRNAARNDAAIETLVCSWEDPERLVERGPWDLVVAADVLYEQRHVPLMVDLLGHLTGSRGQAWIADPGRPGEEPFLERAQERWRLHSHRDADVRSVRVHRLTPS
jgi:predicted nicotinamide N-methyase